MQVLIGFAHTLCKAGCGIVLNVLMECCRRDENYIAWMLGEKNRNSDKARSG